MVYHLPIYLNCIIPIFLKNTRFKIRYPNIQNTLSRTETYHCSYFPSVTRTWNIVDLSVKNASTLIGFKRKLNANMATKNIHFTLDSLRVNSILASMGMHSSQLNSHLYRNNFAQNKFCTCGMEGTIFHFFFECTNLLVLFHQEIFS